jgi:hypothetical protein
VPVAIHSPWDLYSVTKSQQAIRDLVKAIRDITGNMPPLPAVFPDKRPGRADCP